MEQTFRDNLFALMVFYDRLTEWNKDANSGLTEKDKTKIKIITDMIMALLVQYRKREGNTAFNSILEESKKFKFAILPKTENVETVGTFEPEIIKSALKDVLQNTTECSLCDRCDYKKCSLYTLNKFADNKPNNNKPKTCPYKYIIDFDLKFD